MVDSLAELKVAKLESMMVDLMVGRTAALSVEWKVV